MSIFTSSHHLNPFPSYLHALYNFMQYQISYTPNLFPFPHTLSHPSDLSYPHLSSIIHPLIHIAYFCTCMATPKSFQLPLITSQIHLPMCMGPMQTFPSSYPSSLFPYHYALYAHIPLLSLPAAVLHVPIPLPLFLHACKAIIHTHLMIPIIIPTVHSLCYLTHPSICMARMAHFSINRNG